MHSKEMNEKVGYKSMADWLDAANNSIRKPIPVLESIVNDCPDNTSNEFGKFKGILLGRKIGALQDVAEWFNGIDLEEIRKQNVELFELKAPQ